MVALPIAMFLGIMPIHASAKPSLTFAGVEYIHRYSKGNLNEYTPKAQTDLTTWTDMVTINDYANVKSGEDLAKSANSVLDTYKAQKAMVVKTDSVPRSAKREAEHLIVVMFPQPTFIETAFARFLIVDGKGYSIVYSHRVYGKKAGDAMSKWLLKNGDSTERALMKMPTVPKH